MVLIKRKYMLVVILIAAGVRGVTGMCLLAVHIILFQILVKSACVVRTLLNIIVHMPMGVFPCPPSVCEFYHLDLH